MSDSSRSNAQASRAASADRQSASNRSGRASKPQRQQQRAAAGSGTAPAVAAASAGEAAVVSSSPPSHVTLDVDDPYSTPPAAASTAGDAFYDTFAQLERHITQASNMLTQLLRTLKHIKANPQQATQFNKTLSDQLVSTGTSLDDLYLLQTHFNALATRGAQLDQAERARRRSLREQANADIEQMRHNYSLIRGATLQHTGEVPMSRSSSRTRTRDSASYQQDDDDTNDDEQERFFSQREYKQQRRDATREHEEATRHSLLAAARDGGGGLSGLEPSGRSPERAGGSGSSSRSHSSDSSSLQLPATFQREGALEDIGDLDGHMSMLATSARHRAEFMQQLSSDVVQVHELFQDVNYIVSAQQSMIDSIDDNIDDGRTHALQAEEQIRMAREYQRSRRRKLCCLCLLALLLFLFVFLFVWVAFDDDDVRK